MFLQFRKIRHKLLDKSRIVKYLMYAFGEIILVVIGIMLAISLNNWKQEADNEELQTKILLEIKTDLENNLDEIREEIGYFKLKYEGDSTLIAYYFGSRPFNDTLGNYVYLYEISPHFNPVDGGYHLLKAKGIDLIKNDALRSSIVRYYEQSVAYYQKYENERIHVVQNEMVPFNNAHFHLERYPIEVHWRSWKRTPFDEFELKKNKAWLSLIQKSQNLSFVQNIKAHSHEKLIIDLINDIQTELSQND